MPRRTSIRAPRRPSRPPLALALLQASLLAATLDDLVIDTSRRALAVVRLEGVGLALLPEAQEAQWLAALERYIEQYPDPVMRLTSSYPQPLDDYLAALREAPDEAPPSPGLAEKRERVAAALEAAAAAAGARLFADYWVLVYSPTRRPGEHKDPLLRGRPRAAALSWHPSETWVQGARQELARRCRFLEAALASANLRARRVTGAELAGVIESAWGTAFYEAPPARAAEEAPLAEGQVQVERTWVRTPSGYMRARLLAEVGEVLSPEALRGLAARPGRRVLQFWARVPLQQAKRVLKMNRTIQATMRSLRQRREVADLDALREEQQTEHARSRLSYQGVHLFRYRALVQQWAPTLAELEARCEALALEVQEQGQVQLVDAPYQQEQALLSGLPAAWCLVDGPERALDAACLARLAWPGPRAELRPRGVWLGVALPGQQIWTLDPLDPEDLANPVIELLGVMGSGKSMTQKWILTQLVYQGRAAFLVNSARLPNGAGEYDALVEELGGVVLRLGGGSGVRLNPLQLLVTSDTPGDPFVESESQFLAWLDALLREPLRDEERVVAGRAYRRAQAQAGIFPERPATWQQPAPVLGDFLAALLAEPGEAVFAGRDRQDAARLAYKLSRFSQGPAAQLFQQRESLPLFGARVVCFDLADVPEELRRACFQQVLALIRRLTVQYAQHGGSVVLLDESHLLLEDEQSASRLADLVRQSRKQQRLILFTNHTSADSTATRAAQLVHDTAGATLVFRLTPQDDATVHNLHLTPQEVALVTRRGRPEGECLLMTNQGHWLLQVLVPPYWYRLFTTRPREVLRQDAARLEAAHAKERHAAPAARLLAEADAARQGAAPLTFPGARRVPAAWRTQHPSARRSPLALDLWPEDEEEAELTAEEVDDGDPA
jgi:hypothetical protein